MEENNWQGKTQIGKTSEKKKVASSLAYSLSSHPAEIPIPRDKEHVVKRGNPRGRMKQMNIAI